MNKLLIPINTKFKKNDSDEAILHVQKYLKRFGYLTASVDGVFGNETEAALKSYQNLNHLDETGNINKETIEQISLPRCGCPDKRSSLANFRAQGNKWEKNDLTYKFKNFTSDLSEADTRSAIASAFSIWSKVVPLTFTEVDDEADIVIEFATGDHDDGDPFDNVGNVLAHAYYPPPNGGELAGDVHFDESETWSVNESTSGIDLITVAAHELGHSLGLDHSDDRNSIMYASYSGVRRSLNEDDIQGIQSIYTTV